MSFIYHPSNPGRSKAGGPEPVIFFDDFSATTLDRSKWNVLEKGQPFNNELQAYVDSPLTLSLLNEGAEANGVLAITPRFTPGYITTEGNRCDFISARIDTRNKFQFVYGTASARIRLCAGAGLWQAWWLLGITEYPHHGEIDIIEYVGETDWASSAVHGSGFYHNSPFVHREHFPADSPPTGWHVYSVDCEPKRLVFRIDNQVYYEVSRNQVELAGNWSFDEEKFLILNFALGGDYPYYVNNAEKPYRGLPSATLALIKDGKCRMLIDWVKVSAWR